VPANRSMEHAAKRHSINDSAVDTKPYDATPNLTFACAVKRRWFTAGESPARELFVPPGSNRSSSGGNEAAEASGVEGRVGDLASL